MLGYAGQHWRPNDKRKLLRNLLDIITSFQCNSYLSHIRGKGRIKAAMQLIGNETLPIINRIMNSWQNTPQYNLTHNVSEDEVLRIIIISHPKAQKPYFPVVSQTY